MTYFVKSRFTSSAPTASQTFAIVSLGRDPRLGKHKIDLEYTIVAHTPDYSQEKVNVVYFVHLVNEGRYAIEKCFRVVLHKHREIYAVFAACKKGFPIVSSKTGIE